MVTHTATPRAATPTRTGRKPALMGPAFFVAVLVFGFLYFRVDGMYRHILPLSERYGLRLERALRSPEKAAPSYSLAADGRKEGPAEYGGTVAMQTEQGPALVVTAPALRLSLPRLEGAPVYTVTATVAAKLSTPGKLALTIGEARPQAATLTGSGKPETLTWTIPGSTLSGGQEPLRLAASWGPYARLKEHPERAVWFCIYDLKVARR